VEVAFSYATIAMILIELGVSNYLFFGYKKADDKESFLKNAQLYFKFLLAFYFLLTIPFVLVINYINSSLVFLFCLVGIRTLFTLFLNFYSNIFRLNDNPSKIYRTSITINIFSFGVLLLANFYSWDYKLIYFFLPSLFLLLVVAIKFLIFEIYTFSFSGFRIFIKESLIFSWPIIINVLAMSYMNNYAKIYAYGNLSQEEMVQISYILRISLVIQLTHASFSSYFSKALFMDSSHRLNTKIFKQYSIVLLFSTILVLLIILATNLLFQNLIHIPINLSTLLFILYTILWCYIGYLEIYFGIMNANRRVLFYSIFSSIVYTVLLKLYVNVNLLQLSFFMVITALLNLILVIKGLYTLNVVGKENKSSENNKKNG
jgi:O-antigen/teichoic acid export membrane protein